MNRWFRFYDEALDDPKVQLLPPERFKVWVNLLCLACRHDGKLPPIADVAFALRMARDEAGECLLDFTQRGLLDQYEEQFSPHNWAKRQYRSDVSTDRVKRFRETKRNVSPAVSETAPDTDTEQKDYIGGGRAVAVATPLIRPEAHALSDSCLRSIGLDPQNLPPDWYGLPNQIELLLARGHDPPTISATFARFGGNPKPMNYIIRAVENAQPIKQAVQNGTIHEANPNKSALAAVAQLRAELRASGLDHGSDTDASRRLSSG